MKKFIFLLLPASLLVTGCDTGGGAAPIDNAVAADCDNAVVSGNEQEAALCPEGTAAETGVMTTDDRVYDDGKPM